MVPNLNLNRYFSSPKERLATSTAAYVWGRMFTEAFMGVDSKNGEAEGAAYMRPLFAVRRKPGIIEWFNAPLKDTV